ncbi:MAG: lipo-like protein [Hyphomicrobium sp. SCN 65-11]|nr:MAG: lipo-like protein [Hyphomicrobium sp. SCN 65-11]
MGPFDRLLDRFGHWLAGRLESETPGEEPFIPTDREALRRTLRTGDVLLVAGGSTLSTAIKYLTQSTWSHAALYVGDVLDQTAGNGEPHVLIEVTATEGCASAPLSKYERFHTRICRPIGLTEADREALVTFMISRLGAKYDMRNIFDLARYLLPTPPIPTRFRRRMIALGSGEPTRTICSTLIAEAFGRIAYPILPRVELLMDEKVGITRFRQREILHIRHYSLYAPADFDLSPYFDIVKPTISEGFNYKGLRWASDDQGPAKMTETSRSRSA